MPAPEQWWVLQKGPGGTGRGGGPLYSVVESPTRPTPPAGGAIVAAGPFPTAQAAQSWINAQSVPAPPDFGIPNPFSWVGAVAHWIGDAVLSITDVHMWISLGWLLLGTLLIVWGFLLLFRVPQRAARTAATVAPAVA